MGVFIFVIVVVVILGIIIGIANADTTEKARQAYQNSLVELRNDPTNPEKRQQTLALGRAYSNLTRDQKGVTLFDEVALMNDINAACGGAATLTQPAPTIIASSAMSVEARLARLQTLKDQSLITASEYEIKREQLLSEL